MGNKSRRRKEHNPNACINVVSPIDTLWLTMCHPLDYNDEDTPKTSKSDFADDDGSVLIAATRVSSMFGDTMDHLTITSSMSEVSYTLCIWCIICVLGYTGDNKLQ